MTDQCVRRLLQSTGGSLLQTLDIGETLLTTYLQTVLLVSDDNAGGGDVGGGSGSAGGGGGGSSDAASAALWGQAVAQQARV